MEATTEQSKRLKAAQRHPIPWQREPFLLARDRQGIYYYVDRLQKEFGGKDYRVYSGKRGQVRRRSLTDIVEDHEGTIFATKSGMLRLIFSRRGNTGSWIRGKREVELTVLSIEENRKLLYEDLGVYSSVTFHTACD